MVERLSTGPTPVIYVDLDGTLLTANSMKIFMRRLPGILWRNGYPGAAAAALWWMGLRALRIVSHRRMKWHLTGIALAGLSHKDWMDFSKALKRYLRPAVTNYLADCRRRRCGIKLVTAAPDSYARPLGNVLGLDDVLATKYRKPFSDYRELRGEAKLKAIREDEASGWCVLEAFLTDHVDDLAVAAAYPESTILVAPDKKTAGRFREVGATRVME